MPDTPVPTDPSDPPALAAPYKPGDRVTSVHNPVSRGTVVALHHVNGSVSVQWDGYDKSERWSAAALVPSSAATVWIVRWDYYDDWGIEGVFTTEESAQRHADALNADPNKRLGSASVEDYEVQP